MPKEPLEAIEEYFSKVTDPRTPALAGGAREDRTKDHKLIDIIVIAICAVICGAEGWVDIESYGNSKLHWSVEHFSGTAKRDPITRHFWSVFSIIDAQQFQFAFYDWVLAVNEIVAGQVINIDGKCLRGSDEKRLGKRAIYMVSAWTEACECEKAWDCKECGLVYLPWADLNEQMNDLLNRFRDEYYLPHNTRCAIFKSAWASHLRRRS